MHACGEKTINNVNERKLDKKETSILHVCVYWLDSRWAVSVVLLSRNERPFVCEFCNHAFTQKANLNMHLRTHTGEKPFQCHLCGKTFRTQGHFTVILISSSFLKSNPCSFCIRVVLLNKCLLNVWTASLDKHHRTHTGERPYSCEFCEQRFTEKGPLLRHIASKHQEGRPHFCHICNKTFKGKISGQWHFWGNLEKNYIDNKRKTCYML